MKNNFVKKEDMKMIDYRCEIAKKISDVTNISKEELANYIEKPKNSEMGDYAFPCFKLAKELKKAPAIIAEELKNNMDIDKTKNVLEKSLKNNYYYLCREWPYKNLKHRIIAEKMITNTVPNDYKFFMFNGKMDSVMVCTNRASGHPTFRFYDKGWNRLLYQKPELEPESNVERPENYEKMIRIAEQLSENLVHMRVDLYNIDGQIYFGELTFFDQGGFDTDITLETDLKWGELMDLDKIK